MTPERAAASDWLTPDWPAPAHVRALCSTRAGGVSEAPFASLNLGDHVNDDPMAVQANRAIFAKALTMSSRDSAKPVFLNQVHGSQVQWLDEMTPNGMQADACATREAGVACVIMVADCLPVLFTNRRGDQVAAAHAGWRGLAGGVLEEVVREFMPDDEVLAWLGPCIGPTAFEVGHEVQAAFCESDEGNQVFFKPLGGGKYLADLAALARRRLARANVRSVSGNDSSLPWCTVSNPERFFSYRRDQRASGGSGRLAAAVWIDR